MMRKSHGCFVSPFLIGAAALAQTQSQAPNEWIGGLPFAEWTRATGNWGRLRDNLEEYGVEVGGGFTGDASAPWRGGLGKSSAWSTLLDLNVAFDLETMAGLPRTIAYVDAYRIHGSNPSDNVGDAQSLSNIQGDDTWQIAEVWLETWLSEQFRLKAGKVDFNSEFAFNEIGGEFVNSTVAITPCIVGYPTYPDPATSVNVFYVPQDNLYIGVGIYDGATAEGRRTGNRSISGFFGNDDSDAYFFAAEVGYAWTGGESWGSGRGAFGLWHHTADFEEFDGGNESGTDGFWITLEQHLWRENPTTEDDAQGLGAYAGYGHANESVSAFGNTFTIGAAWTGPLERRDADVLGVAIHYADLSDAAGAATPDNETVLELLYKIQVTPAISVKPDLQYILNPGGDGSADDVLVALLRVEVLF